MNNLNHLFFSDLEEFNKTFSPLIAFNLRNQETIVSSLVGSETHGTVLLSDSQSGLTLIITKVLPMESVIVYPSHVCCYEIVETVVRHQ